MVRAGEQDQETYRSKLFNFRGMFESNAGRHTKSLSVDTSTTLDFQQPVEDGSASSRSQGSRPLDADKIPKARTISKEETVAKEARDKLLQGLHHLKFSQFGSPCKSQRRSCLLEKLCI